MRELVDALTGRSLVNMRDESALEAILFTLNYLDANPCPCCKPTKEAESVPKFINGSEVMLRRPFRTDIYPTNEVYGKVVWTNGTDLAHVELRGMYYGNVGPILVVNFSDLVLV